MVTTQSQTKGGFLQLENLYEINYYKNVAGSRNWTNGTKEKKYVWISLSSILSILQQTYIH